ncbi:hypothetical protein AB0A77_09290 [Streptomyces varsoviensis]|uniref:hypothetical protein n=1 Tax=Streptomyces varsoviensis TaxID=67373 RepID=UPI0033FB7B8D
MEANAERIRPRLRGDVYVMRVPEGAYIRSNLGGSILKGASTYEWIQRIAPMLDGTRTLGELCASVPESSRTGLAKLTMLLLGKGYVKNVLEDRPHTLPADVAKNYAANIAFIEYFVESPELRFEEYRGAGIVLAGSGPLLQALANSELRSGVRVLTLAPFPESPFDRERVAEHLAAARERDPEQRIEYVDYAARVDYPPGADSAGVGSGDLDQLAAGAAMVLHVADRPMLGRARRLARAAAAARAASAQAVVVRDEAWIGPVTGADGDATGWESAWRRLGALAPDLVGTDLGGTGLGGTGLGGTDLGGTDLGGADLGDRPEAAVSEFLRGPTVALVANQLCFAAFRHLTGIDGSGGDRDAQPQNAQGRGVVERGHVVRFDLETLETANHAFLPHPLARPVVSDDPARLAALPAAARVDDEELARRAVDCVDPRTGVFAEITERDYEQLPLFVSEVMVSDPVGLAGGPFPVFGCGENVVESRRRAVRRAFERYAAVMRDPRKGDRLYGLDVLTGEAVAVSAAEVFPAEGPRGEVSPARTAASGGDWPEAVRAAVVAAANDTVVTALSAATVPFPRLDLADAELTSRAARYVKLLEIVDQPVEVHDLTALLGLPTFAFSTPEATVGYVSDLDVDAALEEGLERVLLAYQSRAADQPGYAPPPVPVLPARLRGKNGGRRPDSVTLEAAVAGLTRDGGRVVAVPLDHDPLVARMCPFVARAVVVHG